MTYKNKTKKNYNLKNKCYCNFSFINILIEWHNSIQPESPRKAGTVVKEELRCVIGVIRHGDRTPKQKMKMKVNNSLFSLTLRLAMRVRLSSLHYCSSIGLLDDL